MNNLLTVIVPCYNHDRYLLECLESIYCQSYKEFQWIVVDDGSTDLCPQILKENQGRFGYELVLQENKGLSETLTGIIKDYVKGDYICICASDDTWEPQKLEMQLAFMLANPEYALSFSKCYYMNLSSERLGTSESQYFRSGYVFEDIICQRVHLPVNYMCKKKVIEELGYYKSGVIAEDFYMNCLISEKYPIGFINEYLSSYRVAPLETKRDPYSLVQSHRDTIDLFKKNLIYSEALLVSQLSFAYTLSSFIKYKKKAIKYLFLSMKKCYTLRWIKAAGNLIIKWKYC